MHSLLKNLFSDNVKKIYGWLLLVCGDFSCDILLSQVFGIPIPTIWTYLQDSNQLYRLCFWTSFFFCWNSKYLGCLLLLTNEVSLIIKYHNYTANPFPVITTGISLCSNSHREFPVMNTRFPVMNTGSLQWEQGFPVMKTGFSLWEFPCKHYRVSVCSVPFDLGTGSFSL